MKVWVSLITFVEDEWCGVDVHLSEWEAQKFVAKSLWSLAVAAPSVMHDDAPAFLQNKSIYTWLYLRENEVEKVTKWLDDFREATTSPWWSIHEREL